MIIIDKPKLKFLLAGRTLEVTVPRTPRFRYRPNHHYAVGLSHQRPAICNVKILHVVETDDGWQLQVVKADTDIPVYLRKVSGYTTDPAQAVPGEPEPVDRQTLQKLAEQGTVRWRQERAFREAQRETMAIHERVRELEARANRGDQQAKRCLYMIRRGLQKVEERRARDAA